MAKRGNKRGSGEHFVKLPVVMAHHPAFRALSGAAVKIWVELNTKFMGANNGELYLSLDQAALTLHLSKSTAKRAFDELAASGFIEKTRQGQFFGHWATLWALTHQKLKGELPTRAWQSGRLPAPASHGAASVPTEKKSLGTEMAPKRRHGAASVPKAEA